MAKFHFHVSTGFVGSEKEKIVEIDDVELEGLTEDEIDDVVREYYNEWLHDVVNMSYSRVED